MQNLAYSIIMTWYNDPFSTWTNPLQNNHARINHKVLGGPNPIHNLVSAWSDPLPNNCARINYKVPGGPNPIHNPISAWTDPLQNNHARINRS